MQGGNNLVLKVRKTFTFDNKARIEIENEERRILSESEAIQVTVENRLLYTTYGNKISLLYNFKDLNIESSRQNN